MAERRISEKKIASAIEEIRSVAERNLTAGPDIECFGKGMLSACFTLENALEMGHPQKWGKAVNFEVKHELFLPGRFVKYAADERKLEVGHIVKRYQNGDVKLAANDEQIAALKGYALKTCEDDDADRGIKTAARAVIKQLEKVGA